MLAILMLIVFRHALAFPEFPFKVDIKLDEYNLISVNWRLDNVEERIHFALECSFRSDFAWFGFGFSERGEYVGSDLCVWDGAALKDSKIDAYGSIREKKMHHCHLEHVEEYPDGRLTIFFRRSYDTCDVNDYIIEDGTSQLVAIVGKTKRRNVYGEHVVKAIQPTRLLQNQDIPVARMDTDVETLEITSKNVTVPSMETTYWCTVIKLPSMDEKKHIIKYEAIIQNGNEHLVHHMEVFHCEKPIGGTGRWRFPMYNGQCHSPNVPAQVSSCKRVIGAWAMGAPPLIYPAEAGTPIGGSGYFPFVMLEIHYNNPQKMSGVMDNSGMRFYYTSKLRPFDAGVVEVGLEYTDRMAIPPGQRSFPLTGHCTPECTDSLLPNEGIVVFASQLHSHLTGREISTSQVREGVEVKVVNRDPHYSPHWQEIRPTNARILPGDALVTTCIYDTSTRRNITLGGFGIKDEMCVNYIHYYPKSKLEVCKSAVDISSLNSFFEFVNEHENQPTHSQFTTAENYKAIRWNNRLVSQLRKLYEVARIKAECRRNDGQSIQLIPREPVRVLDPIGREPNRCDDTVVIQS